MVRTKVRLEYGSTVGGDGSVARAVGAGAEKWKVEELATDFRLTRKTKIRSWVVEEEMGRRLRFELCSREGSHLAEKARRVGVLGVVRQPTQLLENLDVSTGGGKSAVE